MITFEGNEPMPKEEWATIGVGFNDPDDITENQLRKEHGLNQRAAHFAVPGGRR